MDGYTINEAASVLGVPTERVWELLARGVLAGTPEGAVGMRVYFQPRQSPMAPPPGSGEDPKPSGGNGGNEASAEASPFRELLTEFRNLTERYGQALLALGEARGEVAALRSRVDLLEARMDLRLPSAGMPSAPPVAWTSPPTPGGARDPVAADAVSQTDVAAEDAHPARARRRRGRGGRVAAEDIAEALGRANDPSPSELPDARDVAFEPAAPPVQPGEPPPASAELRPEVAVPEPVASIVPVDAEGALPLDVAAAEAVSLDLDGEREIEPGPTPEMELEVEADDFPVFELPPTLAAEPAQETPFDFGATAPVGGVEPPIEADELEPELPVTASTIPASGSPYSTDIEEHDWSDEAQVEPPAPEPVEAPSFAADTETDFAAELEVATPGWRDADEASQVEAPPATEAATLLGPIDDSAEALPGGTELDEALAALDAVPAAPESEPPPPEPPQSAAPIRSWDAKPAGGSTPDEGEGGAGAASRAYNRLRRIFPG